MLFLRLHGRGQEGGGDLGQGAQVDQVIQGDLAQPVPADHHRRARGDPGRGGQSGSAVQAQVQPRLRLGERSGVDLAARGQEDQEVDQLLVAVRDRGTGHEATVGQLEGDLVVAGDDDVLHPVVVDQRLEPPQPEQGVLDRCCQRVLLHGRPGRDTGIDPLGGLGLEQLDDDGAAAVPLLVAGGVGALLAQCGGQPVGGLLTEHRDQGPVEVPAERARQCSGHRHGWVALSPVPVWVSW